LLLDVADAPENFSPIGLKLGFTGAACADAAAELRHFYTASGKAGQHVFKLRQLYLQLAFAAASVAREYIQDELRAINDTDIHFFFYIALL
jgi:hypothetical protein